MTWVLLLGVSLYGSMGASERFSWVLNGCDFMTPIELAERLLLHLETLLRDEFSSDGDEVTGFARGYLGLPLPDNRHESPHRLMGEWHAGLEARESHDHQS